jgi:hypothetical protein
MASAEDWLMRPVLRGLCSYADLKSGLLDLLDLVKMNEALDVEAHNQELLRRG